MARRTLQFWYCWCKTKNAGDAKKCYMCGASRIEKHAQVHASERAVVFQNPLTGEYRRPARADQPLPEVYARQGFERVEIMNMLAHERETGSVHEATNFAPGNEPSPWLEPERPETPKAVREALIDDVRAAIASGPMTDDGRDDHRFTVAAPV